VRLVKSDHASDSRTLILRQTGQRRSDDDISPDLVMRLLAAAKRDVMQHRSCMKQLASARGQLM
jgi:hypothetical protein